MEEDWCERKTGVQLWPRERFCLRFCRTVERWRDPKNNVIESCTILTTKPNSLVADGHDRMPAILDPDDYERWLDPGITDPGHVLDCLKPFDPNRMKKYPVSSRVNRTENDDAECAREVSVENVATLF
jgi:putative SOS response-associated peptidase YedK